MKNSALQMALELGNFYLDQKDNDTQLDDVKKKFSREEIIQMWNAIYLENALYENLEGYSQPINQLRLIMMNDIFYLEKLHDEKIIEFGKQARWTEIALHGLLKKHEKNTFPVASVVALGWENVEIAKNLIKILCDKPGFFEVTAQWVKIHKILEDMIAEKWKHCIEQYPFHDENEKAFVASAIQSLQTDYPKFKQLKLNTRRARDPGPVRSQYIEDFQFFGTIFIGVAIVAAALYCFSATSLVFTPLSRLVEIVGAAVTTVATPFIRFMRAQKRIH